MAHSVDNEVADNAHRGLIKGRKEFNNTFEDNDKYLFDELISWDGYEVKTDDHESYPQYNKKAQFGHVTLELGMEFSDLDTFKDPVRDYNIYLGRPVSFPKNDSVRYRAICSDKGCNWVCLCSFSNQSQSHRIKTFNHVHTCFRQVRNKLANREQLVKKLAPKIREQPSMNRLNAYNHIKVTYGVIASDHLIVKALKKARETVEGSKKEQYAKLSDYGIELLRTSPRSSIEIFVDKKPPKLFPIFDTFYVCLKPCKRGFLDGCRPLIGLDGCFLKGYYKRELLAAIALDGNNSFYPIVFAVVESEQRSHGNGF